MKLFNQNNQFQIEDYKNFRLDKSCYLGGACMYVNRGVAARRVEYNLLSNIESICLELNLRKRKWLVIGIYKPTSYSEGAFLKSLFPCLADAREEFENIVLLGISTWPLKILKWNKSFIKGQFNYYPLLWMLCLRSSKNLINKIHEKVLSLTSEINDVPFNNLLSINNEVSIHNKNKQTILVEVYKNLNGLSPPTMVDLLTTRKNIYNLRNF